MCKIAERTNSKLTKYFVIHKNSNPFVYSPYALVVFQSLFVIWAKRCVCYFYWCTSTGGCSLRLIGANMDIQKFSHHPWETIALLIRWFHQALKSLVVLTLDANVILKKKCGRVVMLCLCYAQNRDKWFFSDVCCCLNKHTVSTLKKLVVLCSDIFWSRVDDFTWTEPTFLQISRRLCWFELSVHLQLCYLLF